MAAAASSVADPFSRVSDPGGNGLDLTLEKKSLFALIKFTFDFSSFSLSLNV